MRATDIIDTIYHNQWTAHRENMVANCVPAVYEFVHKLLRQDLHSLVYWHVYQTIANQLWEEV